MPSKPAPINPVSERDGDETDSNLGDNAFNTDGNYGSDAFNTDKSLGPMPSTQTSTTDLTTSLPT